MNLQYFTAFYHNRKQKKYKTDEILLGHRGKKEKKTKWSQPE